MNEKSTPRSYGDSVVVVVVVGCTYVGGGVGTGGAGPGDDNEQDAYAVSRSVTLSTGHFALSSCGAQ